MQFIADINAGGIGMNPSKLIASLCMVRVGSHRCLRFIWCPWDGIVGWVVFFGDLAVLL